MMGVLSCSTFSSMFDTWTSMEHLIGDEFLGGNTCCMKIVGVDEFSHVGMCIPTLEHVRHSTWVVSLRSALNGNGYVTI